MCQKFILKEALKQHSKYLLHLCHTPAKFEALYTTLRELLRKRQQTPGDGSCTYSPEYRLKPSSHICMVWVLEAPHARVPWWSQLTQPVVLSASG